jgi:transposase-like protein
MATRLAAAARTREELRDRIEGGLASGDERSALLRLATRLIVEEALEAEVEDALGRGDYERGRRGRRRLPQRLPNRSLEDRRRADRLRRAAGREPAGALPLGAA